MSRTSILKTITRWQGSKRKLYLKCLAVGLASGLVVVAYRLSLERLSDLRSRLYAAFDTLPLFAVPLWFAALAGIGLLLGWISRTTPMIRGSGIPQIKGALLRQFPLRFPLELVLKFVGGSLAIACGMSLGREGPSIQLGALVGKGFGLKASYPQLEEKYLVTGGASAGLAAAFNAPVAGVLFSLEELHKSFSPIMLTCLMIASIASDLVSRNFFGLRSVFDFRVKEVLPLAQYPWLVALGLACGLVGVLFNAAILNGHRLYDLFRLRPEVRPVPPLLLAGVLGFVLPQVLGGGHDLIVDSVHAPFRPGFLVLLIVVKLVFTALCYGSGVPGGIFFPLLVVGALIGRLSAELLVRSIGLDPSFVMNFVILGMAAFFTAVVRAPITGSILISELTGSLSHLLSLIIVSVAASTVAELLRSAPIYDSLLERLLKSFGRKAVLGDPEKKEILVIPVCVGSSLANHAVRELELPEGCFLVGIIRGSRELLPEPDEMVYSGDSLAVLTTQARANQVKPELTAMGLSASLYG